MTNGYISVSVCAPQKPNKNLQLSGSSFLRYSARNPSHHNMHLATLTCLVLDPLPSYTVGSASDNVYFSANFKTPDSASFDICYQQVVFNSTEDSVSTSRLYGWQETDEYWLNCELIQLPYIVFTIYSILCMSHCTL